MSKTSGFFGFLYVFTKASQKDGVKIKMLKENTETLELMIHVTLDTGLNLKVVQLQPIINAMMSKYF